MPALIFCSRTDDPDEWREAFHQAAPELDFRVWPDVGDPADVEVALVWDPLGEELLRFPHLKLIASLGAGVDHLVGSTKLPDGVPMTRIVDQDLTQGMVEYVLLSVLSMHRQVPAYAEQQRRRVWQLLDQPRAWQRRVGILGLGVLGTACAKALVGIGFDVAGWRRRKKTVDGVTGFAGEGQLEPFLSRSDILVCLLPLTSDTEGLLDSKAFAALPKGASFVNAARGAIVVERDLVAALESSQISHAVLDVFTEEPLPSANPLWHLPNVTITPHVASITSAASGAVLVAENLSRVRKGEAPLYRVDPVKGY